MAALDHPGIVKVDEYGEWKGRPWLRMEYMEGIPASGKMAVSVEDRLRLAPNGRLEESEVLDLLEQVLDALHYAHGEGVIHRDVKPGNLLLGSSGVKISDFGLVRVAGEQRLREEMERSLPGNLSLEDAETLLEGRRDSSGGPPPGRTRSLLGTYAYMSPEQREGREVTAATDLYSLGVLTYRALTGESALGMRPPSKLVPGLRGDWDEFLMKALETRPERRYETAKAMQDALPSPQRPARKRKVPTEVVSRKSTSGDERKPARRLAGWHWQVPLALAVLGLLYFAADFLPGWLARQAADRMPPPAPPERVDFMIGEERRDSILVGFDGIVDLEMIWIPSGTFLMGSPPGDPLANPVAERRHAVVLTEGYWMSDIEITREIYYELMGAHLEGPGESPFHPVTGISWVDATVFSLLLTEREEEEGRLPEGYVYRLPTEAEWEFACRAGSATRYFFGDDPSLLPQFANYNERGLAVVGIFRPNPFGLHDILGNAWEWVHDYHAPYPEPERRPRLNPTGPSTGEFKVVRGGSFYDSAVELRSAARGMASPEGGPHIGFRVVLARPLVNLRTGQVEKKEDSSGPGNS